MWLDKNVIDAWPSTVKKIFSFLASVPLACMRKRKNLSHSAITEKYIYFLKVIFEFNRHSTSIEKNFVSDYSTTVLHGTLGLENNLIRLDLHRKKILVIVLLRYVGLRKTQSALDPHRKKYKFSFPATILLWCTGLKKNQSRWIITEINIISYLTTVVCRTWRIFISFLAAVRRAWNLGKMFIGTLPLPEK